MSPSVLLRQEPELRERENEAEDERNARPRGLSGDLHPAGRTGRREGEPQRHVDNDV